MQSQESWQYQGSNKPLQLVSTGVPSPAAHQVLVANRVIGLNPVDWKLLHYGHSAWKPGHIPGVDGAGEVQAVGSSVSSDWIGQSVAYHADLTRHGSFAEYTLVDAKALIQMPDSVSFHDAASIPCPGLTAWEAVEKFPSLDKKQILVCGGGSSVGRIAVQLLLTKGARVWATASSDHHSLLSQWGVSGCVNYRDTDWQQQLKHSVPEQRFDGVIDLISPEHASGLLDLLGYRCNLVSIGGPLSGPLGKPFSKCISLHEIALGAIYQYGTESQFAELTKAGEQLLEKVCKKTLHLTPASVLNFSELSDGLTELKSGGKTTKYLIELTP